MLGSGGLHPAQLVHGCLRGRCFCLSETWGRPCRYTTVIQNVLGRWENTITIRSCFSIAVQTYSLPRYLVIRSDFASRYSYYYSSSFLSFLYLCQILICSFLLNMDPTSSLTIQSWTFYTIAVVIIFARLVFRRIMLKSFADLQADDWIMVFLLLPFTAAIALMGPAADPKATNQRVYRYVLEELQIIIAWLVKACLLILYWRILCVGPLRTRIALANVNSPVAFSTLRRRYVQVVSIVCALSFIITQVSLLSWCQPSDLSDQQCVTYQSHAIVSLTFDILTTVLVLILPTPFIPTPRHLLLTILMITGIATLIFGILARYYILTAPTSQTHVFYYIYETICLVVFANLPFLTSLVVSTTPERIREFGRNISFSCDRVHMPLSPWPRSSRTSVQDIASPPMRVERLTSTVTVMSGGIYRKDWSGPAPVTRPGSTKHGIDSVGRPDSGRGWPLA
jgi:hypothetical protein